MMGSFYLQYRFSFVVSDPEMFKNGFVDSFCFFIFPAPSKTQFISLKPKIPLSPEVTHIKPGNYPDFFFNIPRLKLKHFMPLFGARTSDLYFGV